MHFADLGLPLSAALLWAQKTRKTPGFDGGKYGSAASSSASGFETVYAAGTGACGFV